MIAKFPWYIRLALWFVPLQKSVDRKGFVSEWVTEYKVFRGMVYVLASYSIPPMHYNCRCVTLSKEATP